jgi:hypothetical protein
VDAADVHGIWRSRWRQPLMTSPNSSPSC